MFSPVGREGTCAAQEAVTPKALVLGAAGCRKKDLVPFQALFQASDSVICPFPGTSPAACWVLAGIFGAFSPVGGAGPRAFGGQKLLDQSAMALEILTLV